MPGSNNDVNVLESSHLFSNLAQGIASPPHYIIQGKEYNWVIIWPTIYIQNGLSKKKYFAIQREACRKDVERAFGVLQSCFAIVKGPARFWKKDVLHDIMTKCIILIT